MVFVSIILLKEGNWYVELRVIGTIRFGTFLKCQKNLFSAVITNRSRVFWSIATIIRLLWIFFGKQTFFVIHFLIEIIKKKLRNTIEYWLNKFKYLSIQSKCVNCY